MPTRPLIRFAFTLALSILWFVILSFGQTETATVSGLITDNTGAVVTGAEVKLQSVERGTVATAATNNAGIYVFASVHPGQYQMTVKKPGFKQVDFLSLIVNVQDHVEQNFRLQVGSVTESITVTGNELHVNTEDAAVSTVVDRHFADELPLNGRTFQALIELAPGVVLAPTSATSQGQFSVNGQRTNANYFMIDGVSANVGAPAGANLTQFGAGSLPATNVLGGTNNLLPVDAMQEFRIQTSTYAAEFGRSPGAQVSILSRSGTNSWHGSLFDYFRNDVLDANDWFANASGLPKAEERQNDFGGTVGGPVIKDKAFVFIAYEGIRLRLPQTGITTVPSLSTRANAPPAIQPYLNAFPLPTGPEILDQNGNPTGQAPSDHTFSNQGTVDSLSARGDYHLSNRVNVFGRFSYAPSSLESRGGASLNNISFVDQKTETVTLGSLWEISQSATNDFRFNYSRATGSNHFSLDTFGGAAPVSNSGLFPSPFSNSNAIFAIQVTSGAGMGWSIGDNGSNVQRQVNVIDNFSKVVGTHTLKFGADYRRLSPHFDPRLYFVFTRFQTVASFEGGSPAFILGDSNQAATLHFSNLGTFAQDTWKIAPRLTLSYGVRWELDFVPSLDKPLQFLVPTAFNDLPNLGIAAPGTPLWNTRYGNFAPRVGIAYQARQNPRWQTVLRGGFGIFYDLASQQVGEVAQAATFPFGASFFTPGGTFPLTPAETQPPPITLNPPLFSVTLFDPHLALPYTLQWSAAIEQAIGSSQTLTATYVGAGGRKLLSQKGVSSPNATFFSASLISNVATSSYNSLQVQYAARFSSRAQMLASYTFSHAIDTSSASDGSSTSNFFIPGFSTALNRGPSDFDIRHSLSAGLSYDIPAPSARLGVVGHTLLGGWSVQSIIRARSASPVDVQDANFSIASSAEIRPDVVPGVPLYVFGRKCDAVFGTPCPGGKGINPATFTDTSIPVDSNGNPTRQGTLGRNALRGFGATQWDLAVHRDIKIHEGFTLEFRSEFFNVLNHPNFGSPFSQFSTPLSPQFGLSAAMLGRSLGPGGLSGGLNPLYQLGGPRSIQFSLRFVF